MKKSMGCIFMKKDEKLPKAEQVRNEAYNEYVESITPKNNLFLSMLKAFVLGGIICTIGQVILNVGTNTLGLN